MAGSAETRHASEPLPKLVTVNGDTARPLRNPGVPSRRIEFDAPFYKSIRFRLTAWYAVILILLIVGLAVSLHTLLVRALTNDVESRLGNAAEELAPNIGVSARAASQSFVVDQASVDAILLSGLWIQVFNTEQQAVDIDAPGALTAPPFGLESALQESNVFTPEENVYKTVNVDGANALVIVAPIRLNDESGGEGPHAGWIVVGESLGSRDQIIEIVDQILWLFGVLGVGLAVMGGWLIAGRALAPVERITRTADSIARSDGLVSLSSRLDVPVTGDELSRLAYTFNTMLGRIESAFNTQRRFVSDASHELRTPLTSVRGNVDVLLRQLKSDRLIEKADIVEELGVVQRESSRMGRLIDDMLVLARTDATNFGDILKLQPVSLEVLAREAFRTANQLGKGQDLTLTVVEPVTLYGDGDRLVQVMIILMDNAIRHTPESGSVELRVDRAIDSLEGEPCARIQVIDTGSGISPEHIPHLFERFYRIENARTRASGGTGLGLSIALAIVRGHHGWIDVDTAPGNGTTFSVWLPIAANAEPADDSAPPSGPDTTIDRMRRRLNAVVNPRHD
jgi:signal transduction histidine kinase